MAITKRGLVLSATAAAVTAVTVTGAGLHLSQGQAFFQESPKELIDEVWQLIDRNYVDATFNQVDWRAVRQEYLGRAYSNKEEAYEAIREMLGKLDDPYTRFMDPQEFKNMQIDTSGELTGVGIQLAQDEETKELIVVSPIEDTPAFEAGIMARDVIVEIDGQSTQGMDTNAAVNLIRGPEGSTVKLTIRRGEQEMEFDLRRARIELHPVRYSIQQGSRGEKVGYIRLTQFSANAADEMRNAIEDLESKQVDGYVLDLRINPGGLLYASIDIARMWIDEGLIVSTVDRQGISEQESANGTALTDKPLVVLVDGGSASASEILSGALQDDKRAVLIGSKTFGKGLVQSVRGLGDGSGLAVTVAKYLTPSGRDINQAGIEPDIKIELTDEQRQELFGVSNKIGTDGDLQYVKALEILNQQIAAARQSPKAEATP
ncbi:MAG: carboxyl-terminal processing protease CtpC [Leptolyngbya sp. IPPAS B-1204]|uniref:Carboxyl-terminal-processing protease n=1 Tax=Leptolyngbya sp. NK1-12 TaxID=2547451 RepID=A0AA97AHY0_9CYAN|nr:PDZ domain-containing protein [Elainella sp. C42_A2020_010]RNJ71053.1 MAG: PDZ domain-containing protein [Leptolyngbya sp. IPPAS B-1204]WNZ23206.1 PDZ domain-containing protein [Leptolyngbya sp. NK1-12]